MLYMQYKRKGAYNLVIVSFTLQKTVHEDTQIASMGKCSDGTFWLTNMWCPLYCLNSNEEKSQVFVKQNRIFRLPGSLGKTVRNLRMVKGDVNTIWEEK